MPKNKQVNYLLLQISTAASKKYPLCHNFVTQEAFILTCILPGWAGNFMALTAAGA